MDYRRRYLRRLANQNKQSNTNEEKVNTNINKNEEKPAPEKVDEKSVNSNLYLQRLLVKNNSSINNNITLSSVNESLPSFTTNIRDILATEENKQRAIKYVIQKRNEEKYGTRSSIPTEADQEESNPVLSNKYYKYGRNITITKDIQIKNPEVSKYHNYNNIQRNNNNIQEENINQDNKDENKNKNDTFYSILRRKFQESSSETNINNIKNAKENNIFTNTVYLTRNKINNQNIENNDTDKNEKSQTRYRYTRYMRKKENEPNEQKEQKEENVNSQNEAKNKGNKENSIPLDLKF